MNLSTSTHSIVYSKELFEARHKVCDIGELREAIYKSKNYSNNKVIDYFTSKLEVVCVKNINYKFSIDEELLPFLIKMTLLT